MMIRINEYVDRKRDERQTEKKVLHNRLNYSVQRLYIQLVYIHYIYFSIRRKTQKKNLCVKFN